MYVLCARASSLALRHRRSFNSISGGPSIPSTGLLTRDFIGFSLYDRQYGYFNKPGIIHSPPELPFKQFLGGGAYKKHTSFEFGACVDALLKQPHYATAIAEWMLRTHAEVRRSSPHAPLHIIEFGGGAGTCAANLLDFLQWSHHDLYQNTQYTIVEMSTQLSREQQKRLARHGRHFRTVNMSATDWKHRLEGPVFVLALEVLDNLPHDKVVIHPDTGEVFETWVVPESAASATASPFVNIPKYTPSTGAGFVEVLKPMQDDYIKRAWNYYQQVSKMESDSSPKRSLISRLVSNFFQKKPSSGLQPIYLPTVSLQVFDMMKTYLPQHYTFMADFNSLPENDVIDGILSPIVASQAGSANTDYPTYLVPIGIADIFFPTNFTLLRRAYEDICGRPCQTELQREFLLKYARNQARDTETRNGDNPMIDDYSNMSVLTTSISSSVSQVNDVDLVHSRSKQSTP